MNIPEGWTQKTLGEFLTVQQSTDVEKILKETPEEDSIKKLKEYLRPLETELKGKGILPDYLAYVLYANYNNITP